MIFEFKNIGMVENATIEVNGLTVIAGLNDIGKSFLSKAIFSIIKTNKEAVREVKEVKSQQLQQHFQVLLNLERIYNAFKTPTEPTLSPNSNELFARVQHIFVALAFENTDGIKKDLKIYQNKIIESFTTSTHPLR